jgi:hypothetical protein
MPTHDTPKPSAPPHDSFAVLLTSLVWYVACPGALCLTAMGIIAGGNAAVQGLDLLYWTAALLAPAARHIEVRFLGVTPTPPWTFRRYAARFMAAAAGLWLAAHGVAYLT